MVREAGFFFLLKTSFIIEIHVFPLICMKYIIEYHAILWSTDKDVHAKPNLPLPILRFYGFNT